MARGTALGSYVTLHEAPERISSFLGAEQRTSYTTRSSLCQERVHGQSDNSGRGHIHGRRPMSVIPLGVPVVTIAFQPEE